MVHHESDLTANQAPEDHREAVLDSATGLPPIAIRAILGDEPNPSPRVRRGSSSSHSVRTPSGRRIPNREPRYGDSIADMDVAGTSEDLPPLTPEDQTAHRERAAKWISFIRAQVGGPEKLLDDQLRRAQGDPRLLLALSAKDSAPESQTYFHQTAQQRAEARRVRRRW